MKKMRTFFIFLLTLCASKLSYGDTIRITQVNHQGISKTGNYQVSADVTAVFLEANILRSQPSGGPITIHEKKDLISWKANDSVQSSCDPIYGCETSEQNFFEMTTDGVIYHVIDQQPVTLTASFSDQGTIKEHSIQITPTKPVSYRHVIGLESELSQFCPKLNPSCVLNGHATAVTIRGKTWYSLYLLDSEWVPYSDGIWAQDGKQLVFHSYIPVYNYLYHYGYFRHHSVWGWVWTPNPNFNYRPHSATFFFQEESIFTWGEGMVGWLPFRSDLTYSAGYGFDDGYWNLSQNMATAVFYPQLFTFGTTIVPRSEFLSGDYLVYRGQITRKTQYRLLQRAWARSFYHRSLIGTYQRKRITRWDQMVAWLSASGGMLTVLPKRVRSGKYIYYPESQKMILPSRYQNVRDYHRTVRKMPSTRRFVRPIRQVIWIESSNHKSPSPKIQRPKRKRTRVQPRRSSPPRTTESRERRPRNRRSTPSRRPR
ncbi:MAG: hypothetical protein CL678_01660 [Bdellovibrionaceae bacterium]|nr:hypothetical protein [Pseudobdellovibrionaceae bacterium]